MAYSSVLKNKKFIIYFIGVFLSNIGNAFTVFVFPLMILKITNSPIHLGIASALVFVPYALLGLPAGVLIDKLDKKRIMQYADFLRIIAYISIPLYDYFGNLSIYHMYIVSIISGIALVFHSISEISIIPKIVEKQQLTEANSYIYASQNIAEFIGPILGGILYSLIGYSILIIIDAFTFVISIISLSLISIEYIKPSNINLISLNTILKDIKTGINYIFKAPLIKNMAIILVISNLIISPYYLYIVLFVKEVLEKDSKALGVVFGIASLGALLGSLTTNYLRIKFSFKQMIILILFIGFMFRMAIPFSTSVHFLSIFLGFTYFTQAILNIAIITLRQESTPEYYLGRVNSVFKTAVFTSRPAGLFLGGILLEKCNSFWALFLSSIACFLIFIYACIRINSNK
ncbi:MFS transporter [Staphylococcus americanisciuri]|uniref:MFS transporter n=1 Tax=Staphylococcus americanisciuri TaxID=2973940 RepID=A0ABT2F022_9STAP|nr:MFS transporter [Staphylococcus americanisciuri]MCS4485796.1 MFS transporter [Staphylococcus americanisciuri]